MDLNMRSLENESAAQIGPITVVGTTLTADKDNRNRQARNFDGSSYILTGETILGTTMSASAWFKTSASGATYCILARRSSSSTRQWLIATSSITNNITCNFYNGKH